MLTDTQAEEANQQQELSFAEDARFVAQIAQSGPEVILRFAVQVAATDKKRAKRLRSIAVHLLRERRIAEQQLLDQIGS